MAKTPRKKDLFSLLKQEDLDLVKGRKVFLYGRISRKTSEKNIRLQRLELKELCDSLEKNGAKDCEVLEEEGVTGASPPWERPEGKKIFDAINKGEKVAVMVRDVSRWARDVQSAMEAFGPLRRSETPFFAILDGVKYVGEDTPFADQIVMIVNAYSAEAERRKNVLKRMAAEVTIRKEGKRSGMPSTIWPLWRMYELMREYGFSQTDLLRYPSAYNADSLDRAMPVIVKDAKGNKVFTGEWRGIDKAVFRKMNKMYLSLPESTKEAWDRQNIVLWALVVKYGQRQYDAKRPKGSRIMKFIQKDGGLETPYAWPDRAANLIKDWEELAMLEHAGRQKFPTEAETAGDPVLPYPGNMSEIERLAAWEQMELERHAIEPNWKIPFAIWNKLSKKDARVRTGDFADVLTQAQYVPKGLIMARLERILKDTPPPTEEK